MAAVFVIKGPAVTALVTTVDEGVLRWKALEGVATRCLLVVPIHQVSDELLMVGALISVVTVEVIVL